MFRLFTTNGCLVLETQDETLADYTFDQEVRACPEQSVSLFFNTELRRQHGEQDVTPVGGE